MREFTVLPSHVGFIMDGNRRWAKEHNKTTPQGHKAGSENLERIVEACYNIGIPHVTFYAFSTENWNRPQAEITALMSLFSRYLDELRARWESGEREVYHRTRIRFLGDMSRFDDSFVARVKKIETLSNTENVKMTMNIALNYGGRAEILRAVNQALAEGKTNLTEQDISDRLYTAGQPDPDLIVRTGGEMRLSNFLLWQSSYAEYYSDPCYWPDFDEEHLCAALAAYEKRVRKFGGDK